MSGSQGESDTKGCSGHDGRTRRLETPGATAERPESEKLRYRAQRRVGGSGPLPFPSQRCALLSVRLQEGGGARRGRLLEPAEFWPAARVPTPTPAAPRSRAAQARASTHAHSHTHAHQHTWAPAPTLPLGGDPPALRHSRLRLPACVYNFVLLPRPPCSWKGGGGMWKAAALRLTGGSSGGLQRWPERLSFARVARPLLAVPRTCAGLCVLPPCP